MLISTAARAAARAEDGFTLIELMIGMMTGIIVTGVLFSVLIFSVNETTRLSDVTQANQLGRTTMTHIVDELHSACLSSQFKPVQESSTTSRLVFVTGYSEEAEIPSVATVNGGVRKEEIEWNAKEEKLWDSSYAGAGTNSKGEYTFATTPTKVLIGENITRSVEPSGKKEAIPIFKYFAYATKASKGTAEVSSALNEAEPLGASGAELKSEASKVASVLISFNTATTDKKDTLASNASISADRSVDLNSQVTLAFSAPSSEATIKEGPCE
jgi:type II secretory pathway pseudopilin PulG